MCVIVRPSLIIYFPLTTGAVVFCVICTCFRRELRCAAIPPQAPLLAHKDVELFRLEHLHADAQSDSRCGRISPANSRREPELTFSDCGFLLCVCSEFDAKQNNDVDVYVLVYNAHIMDSGGCIFGTPHIDAYDICWGKLWMSSLMYTKAYRYEVGVI